MWWSPLAVSGLRPLLVEIEELKKIVHNSWHVVSCNFQFPACQTEEHQKKKKKKELWRDEM